MEETPKKSGWKIFLYLTPVYLLVAIPLFKWTLKNNSNDVALSKDECNAFNSTEGEIKKADPAQYNPNLNDGAYTVNYRSGGSKQGTREEYNWGYRAGYLTQAVSKNLKNPKALDELFNNQWVVKGFMSRTAVKNALSSRQSLQDFLENDPAVNIFFANPVIKSAIGDQRVLRVLTESDMAKTLLAAQAVQDLIKDSEAVEMICENNPGFMSLLRNPGIKRAIMANRQAAPLALIWE